MSYEVPRFMSELDREIAGPNSVEAQQLRLLAIQERQKEALIESGTLEKARDIVKSVLSGGDDVIHVVDNGIIFSVTDFLEDDGLTRACVGGMQVVDKDGVHIGFDEAIKLSRPYIDPNDPDGYEEAHVWIPLIKPTIRDDREINGDFDIDDMMCVDHQMNKVERAVGHSLLDDLKGDYTTIGGVLDEPYMLPYSIHGI